MFEELIQLDQNTFLYLNNLGVESWDGFWLFLTNKWSAVPLYLLLLVLSYRHLGVRKTLLVVVTVILLITCTDQLANFFKYGLKRLRPCHEEEFFGLMRLVKASCGGKYAFFSAHAANASAVAFFFVFLLRKKLKYFSTLLLFWAALVAYSRIYIGVHYPLDIITGALVGLFFSWLFYKLYNFGVHKFSL
jgi:undecaprenyl-diphosphatase